MFEYIILTSDYQIAADTAKEYGLEIGQWNWIRDRFKDPIVYKKWVPFIHNVYPEGKAVDQNMMDPNLGGNFKKVDIWETQVSFEE